MFDYNCDIKIGFMSAVKDSVSDSSVVTFHSREEAVRWLDNHPGWENTVRTWNEGWRKLGQRKEMPPEMVEQIKAL